MGFWTVGPVLGSLMVRLAAIKQAVVDSSGQWRAWYWICAAGILVFILSVFVVRGRWSPAAKADADAHDALVAREMARLSPSVRPAE